MSYRRPSNNVNNNSSNYGSNQPLALNSAGSTINIGGSLAQQQQQQSVAGTNQHKYYYTFFAPNRHQQLQSNKHQRLQDQYYQCIHSQPPLITQDTVSMHLQQQHQTAKENRFFVPRPEKDRLRLGNKKIVSVAFIDCGGGGGISNSGGIGHNEQVRHLVNQIIGKNIFTTSNQSNYAKELYDEFPIDSYHDVDNNMIYMLHAPKNLDSTDMSNAVRLYQKFIQQQQQQGVNKQSKPGEGGGLQDFPALLEDREYRSLRAMLLLFHVCHIILFIQPGRTFDLQYLRLFRTLQITKQNVNPVFLAHLGISSFTADLKLSSLYSPGRVLPVVGFIFDCNKVKENLLVENNEAETKHRFEQLEQSLETQIRSLLRKGKFSGTDNTRTPLFMVDPQKCVFLVDSYNPKDTMNDDNFGSHEHIMAFAQSLFSLAELPPSAATTQPNDVTPTASNGGGGRTAKSSRSLRTKPYLVSLEGADRIQDFLLRQYDYFKRQMQTGKRYILPSSYNWYNAAWAFEELMAGYYPAESNLMEPHLEKIRVLMNPDLQFSEGRCAQAFAVATDHFAMILREHPHASNNAPLRNQMIEETLMIYDSYSCGPFVAFYRDKLKQRCLEMVSEFYPEAQPKMVTVPPPPPQKPGSSAMDSQLVEFILYINQSSMARPSSLLHDKSGALSRPKSSSMSSRALVRGGHADTVDLTTTGSMMLSSGMSIASKLEQALLHSNYLNPRVSIRRIWAATTYDPQVGVKSALDAETGASIDVAADGFFPGSNFLCYVDIKVPAPVTQQSQQQQPEQTTSTADTKKECFFLGDFLDALAEADEERARELQTQAAAAAATTGAAAKGDKAAAGNRAAETTKTTKKAEKHEGKLSRRERPRRNRGRGKKETTTTTTTKEKEGTAAATPEPILTNDILSMPYSRAAPQAPTAATTATAAAATTTPVPVPAANNVHHRERVWIGFEYITPSGKRFFLNHNHLFASRGSSKALDARSLLNSELPLFFSVPSSLLQQQQQQQQSAAGGSITVAATSSNNSAEKDKNTTEAVTNSNNSNSMADTSARLNQIYIVVPDCDTSFGLNPRIMFSAPAGSSNSSTTDGVDASHQQAPQPQFVFDLGSSNMTTVVLPRNSFVCVKLSFVHTFDGVIEDLRTSVISKLMSNLIFPLS